MKTRKFKIAGQDWALRVLKRHTRLKDCFGYCDYDKNVIYINGNATSDQQKSTLLHEVIHVLEYIYDIKLGEHRVKCLEAGLFGVFDIKLRE